MNLIGRGDPPPTPEADGESTTSPEAPERFTLGDAPFWPVDRLVEPDAWAGHIPFAFWIVEALRPRLLVELGTHSGNSYLAFAQAVHRLGLDAACFAIDTWQGDAHAGYYGEEVFQELARYHDARYGAFSRLVRSTFDEAVQHFPDGSVDLLHVDGYHTYEAAERDFEVWSPKLSTRAVVLFHDINVREGSFGVWRLWGELCRDRPHFEFRHAHGLGVLGVGSDLPAAVTALWHPTGDVHRVRIRDAFGRLGSSVADRMDFQARAAALQNEIERLTAAVGAAAQDVAARDEQIRRAADARAPLEEAVRAAAQDVAARAEVADQRWLIHGLQQEIVRLGTLRETDRQELMRRVDDARASLGEAVRQAAHDVAARDDLIRRGADARDELIRRGADARAAFEEAVRAAAQDVAARDELIRRGADERAALEEAVRAAAQDVAARDELIRRGADERAALEDRLVSVHEQLRRVEGERAQTSAEAAALRADLWALHQSRSLRLTEPLRRAAAWYRAVVAWVRRLARSP